MHGNITSMVTPPDHTVEALQRSKVNLSSLTCFNNIDMPRSPAAYSQTFLLFPTRPRRVRATFSLFSSFLGLILVISHVVGITLKCVWACGDWSQATKVKYCRWWKKNTKHRWSNMLWSKSTVHFLS